MNSLQHLLVAPAALGLMVPLAGVSSPTANAAELNINGVSEYASSTANSLDQVTSVTQFSDVYPTDWAYQALSNLVETYGCVAGYPNGTFRGNRAMTRYEAAALLNACLDSVTGMTDELKRLIREFETELAIIKGRVDGLEARVGELEATQFSTTTKLKGLATFATGATRFKGSATRLRSESNAVYGSTVFNTDLQLALETSFRGNDQLTTVLRAGTIGESSVFGNGGPSGLSVLETAYQADAGANALAIDKLFYAFPLADTVTITAGPLVGQEDMLAVWPSAYPSDPILDLLALNGAPGPTTRIWVLVWAFPGLGPVGFGRPPTTCPPTVQPATSVKAVSRRITRPELARFNWVGWRTVGQLPRSTPRSRTGMT